MNYRPDKCLWQREYIAWFAAQPKADVRPLSEGREPTIANHWQHTTNARMSDLIKLVFEILDNSEIMGYWQLVANRHTAGDRFSLWDHDDYKVACYYTGDYVNWYRAMNHIEGKSIAYSCVTPLIRDIAILETKASIYYVRKYFSSLNIDPPVDDDIPSFGRRAS